MGTIHFDNGRANSTHALDIDDKITIVAILPA